MPLLVVVTTALTALPFCLDARYKKVMGACIIVPNKKHIHDLPTGGVGQFRFSYKHKEYADNFRTRKYKDVKVLQELVLPSGHVVQKGSTFDLVSEDFVNQTWGLYREAQPINVQSKCLLHYKNGRLSIPTPVTYSL